MPSAGDHIAQAKKNEKFLDAITPAAAGGTATLYVSWISLAEVYYVTYRQSVDKEREVRAKATVEGLKRLAVTIVPAGEVETLKAGHIKAKFTLSLADAFVAALGQIHNAKIVTGDPEFKPLEAAKEIRVLWLPEKPKTRTR